VIAELTEGDKTIVALTREKAELENNNQAGSNRYGEVLHQLETLGYFELGHKAEKSLWGLVLRNAILTGLLII